MGAATVATTAAVSQKQVELCSGRRSAKGATIKVFEVTGPSSYDAGGSTMDLSGFFPNRVFWAFPQNPSVNNGSNTYAQCACKKGTAKTDAIGGYASNDWKLQFSAGATESSSNMSAYVVTVVACGY